MVWYNTNFAGYVREINPIGFRFVDGKSCMAWSRYEYKKVKYTFRRFYWKTVLEEERRVPFLPMRPANQWAGYNQSANNVPVTTNQPINVPACNQSINVPVTKNQPINAPACNQSTNQLLSKESVKSERTCSPCYGSYHRPPVVYGGSICFRVKAPIGKRSMRNRADYCLDRSFLLCAQTPFLCKPDILNGQDFPGRIYGVCGNKVYGNNSWSAVCIIRKKTGLTFEVLNLTLLVLGFNFYIEFCIDLVPMGLITHTP